MSQELRRAARTVLAAIGFGLVCAMVLLPMIAQAQVCVPASTSAPMVSASPLYLSANGAGVCARWYCYTDELTSDGTSFVRYLNTFCGTWAQLHLVGARVQTIQKASDPLKSLQTLGNRIAIVPMSDPSMAGMPP